MARIYVASSWRNALQPDVVAKLRRDGHEVYDFRKPAPGVNGFSWAEIDPKWSHWTGEQYRNALNHPLAVNGYAHDIGAMQWADTCVLVLPCGRSAHLELGWMAGAGKRTIVLTRDGEEPELMAKMATKICVNLDEVRAFLGKPASQAVAATKMLNYKTVVMKSGDCGRCAGCGYLDDGEMQPFKYWLELPTIQMGLVKPVECPDCNGTGDEKKTTDQSTTV